MTIGGGIYGSPGFPVAPITTANAVTGQVLVWTETKKLYVPKSVATTLVAGTNITITKTEEKAKLASSGGSGSELGVLFLNGEPVYKSQPPTYTTWSTTWSLTVAKGKTFGEITPNTTSSIKITQSGLYYFELELSTKAYPGNSAHPADTDYIFTFETGFTEEGPTGIKYGAVGPGSQVGHWHADLTNDLDYMSLKYSGSLYISATAVWGFQVTQLKLFTWPAHTSTVTEIEIISGLAITLLQAL